MTKTIKIISTLLIAILLVTAMSQVCLASGSYIEIIDKVKDGADSANVDTGKINDTAGRIIKMIRNIAAVAAVVILSILGIKYMIGSTEERAEYKKSFIPLIVGIIVVVSAASIASAIFSVAG